MTRTLAYRTSPSVLFTCDGIPPLTVCLHRGADAFAYSVDLPLDPDPWPLLLSHGWTEFVLPGQPCHRCGSCNADVDSF